ncbi:unnamed protein product [Clonostachys rhizophaga]|uniref:Long-chain-alcohol oxidase n=1 Tax=Clonostachys rhizophaga TaxID=160324 RepID=A0A9N9YGR6_9HYPO|nr:unnamed protein product [Clonostachys rhizophaga]
MGSLIEHAAEVPLAAPLAPLAPTNDFTPTQWSVFLAIADTVIPAIDTGGLLSARDGLEKKYYGEQPSDIPAFRELIRRMLFEGLPKSDSDQLRRVLDILSYSAGSLVLTGRTSAINNQPRHVREQILLSWSQSRFAALRLLQRQLVFITKQCWARTSPTFCSYVGIPRVPINCKVAKGYDFGFLQIPPGEEPEVIETDVVIVGSGCGGAVSARVLAEAGLRVLVVDKGYYWSPEYFPMEQDTGPINLLMNGTTDDGSVIIIAGQTWGGGGTINWSASLQLPGYVRREWANTGLPYFTSSAFQDSFERVSEAMSVSTENLRHSKPNQKLIKGCQRVGWSHAEVPQNCGGEDHFCGQCGMGCRSGGKKGPTQVWLPKASAAGATFMEGFDVTRVTFDDSVRGERKATGVEGIWRPRASEAVGFDASSSPRKVIVRAKKVIVSGGTIQSPLLLLRSGLKNRQIGRNLYLHPVALLGAVYDEEMDPWEGPIISAVCTEFENIDGAGHGVKLETTSMLPWSWLVWVPWKNGPQYKEAAAKMKNTAGFISVSKDKHTGRVYPDPQDGRFRVDYSPSQLDKSHILAGLEALARINFEAGAREIFSSVPTLESFVRREGEDVATTELAFQEWLEKLRSHGFPAPETGFVAAHQMGTCRMSASPKKGVVDPKGQVWGTKGLYVIDASVFPTASGVNPFLTTMAIADSLSRDIARGWSKERL